MPQVSRPGSGCQHREAHRFMLLSALGIPRNMECSSGYLWAFWPALQPRAQIVPIVVDVCEAKLYPVHILGAY